MLAVYSDPFVSFLFFFFGNQSQHEMQTKIGF